MERIVACPNCGQKNRVEDGAQSSQAICAKCWTRLIPNVAAQAAPPRPTEPFVRGSSAAQPRTQNTQPTDSGTGWFWILLIGGFFAWVAFSESNKQRSVTPPSPRVAPSYPAQPLPITGQLQVFTASQRVAPLEIKTSAGAHYFVKLVDSNSGVPVMAVFVRGGSTVEVEVPLGMFEIRYASGESWYGADHLFGPETVYSKAEEVFHFKNDGYQISGFTITLYSVSGGNLRTSRISPNGF